MTVQISLSTDELAALVAAFEDGTIDNCEFSHPEHIHVIWSLVRSWGTLGGVARFEDCLKRITEAGGHPEKYHATITYVLGILMGERVAANPDASWEEFVSDNQDLFEWPSSLLASLYPDGELETPQARAQFLLPSTCRTSADIR